MKRSFLFAVLLLAGAAFAQTGLMGGSDGIHQQNAKTLGQWRFVLGMGGDFTVDPWALSRGANYYVDGERGKIKDVKVSSSGAFFFGMGFSDYFDAGVAFNINYDRSYADDYFDAFTNIRQGDLDLWMKARAPFISDSSVFGLAMQMDVFMPIGAKDIGLRPRHAWYIRGNGETNAFTANEVVVGATGIFTLDLTRRNIPFRWNTSVGFMYANMGANTLVYSTGIDWDIIQGLAAFLEFSGEFRVEDNGMPIDFLEDPMLVTPGLRIHTPVGIDIAGGIDISTRMLRVRYDRDKEFKNIEDFTIGYVDREGHHVTYGYTPSMTYAITGLLSWTFGGAEKAPERQCPQGLPPAPDTLVKKDTLVQVDTLQHVDTLFRVDTLQRIDTVVVADTLRDADADGVTDSLDQCPNTSIGLPVDSVGCLIDADGDGVTDSLDKCPNSPKDITVNRDGCPRDFDMDGVPDYLDMCPNTAAEIGVDSTGCAKDEDRDGVPDAKDQCPLTPKNAPVDTTGCPIDTDRDSVPDYLDKCPNNLRGVKVDKKGCPLSKKEDLEKLKKGINFKSGSTILTKPSYKTLDDLTALMVKFADVSIEIQGHTDNQGDSTYNENLSQGRAQSAVDYILRKGIEMKRLKAVGYGSRMPIADNKTGKGRAKNRRVEIIPFYADDEPQTLTVQPAP